MPYSKQELLEARRQISSTLHKLEETVRTLEGIENPARCKPQITLAKRRIRTDRTRAAAAPINRTNRPPRDSKVPVCRAGLWGQVTRSSQFCKEASCSGVWNQCSPLTTVS